MIVTMVSLWRNDEHRQIRRRCEHLLSKSGGSNADVSWLWIVGDSTDRTETILREYEDATTVRLDTGLVGEDVTTRRLRSGTTASMAFKIQHRLTPAYCLLHESDLKSPPNVVARLLEHANSATIVAGWPTLSVGGEVLFYDTYAYRGLNNENFHNRAPYHASYRPDEPFAVSSVGSVWMAPWNAVAGREMREEAIVDLCRQWRHSGYRLLVDPTLRIEQPADLWEAS